MKKNEQKRAFSIIIPVYNTSTYIDKCLNSIINQSIDKSLFEIICIDDGSTDDSISKIQNFSQNFDNIILKINAHQGVSEARNTGLKIASGEYVWFVDSDDFVAPDSLSKLFETINKNNFDEIEFVSCAFKDGMSDDDILSQFEIASNLGQFNNGSRLFKRKIIFENDLKFNSKISYGEDTLFLTEFREMASSKFSSDVIGYCYRKARDFSAISSLTRNMNKWADSAILSAIQIQSKIISGQYNKKQTIDFLVFMRKRVIEILANFSKDEANLYLKKYSDCVLFKDFAGNEFNAQFKNSILSDYYSYRSKIHPEEKSSIHRIFYSIKNRLKRFSKKK